MSVPPLPVKIAYDLFLALIVSIFTVFHCLRLRLRASKRRRKWINIENISYLIIFTSLFPRLFSATLYPIAYYGPYQFFNDDTCVYFIYTRITESGFNKLFIHLFIILRCQVVANATNRIFYIIGYLFTFSDVLFVVFAYSKFGYVAANYLNGQCVPDLGLPIYIWWGTSDCIIGLYFLIAFVLPLRKYIAIEQEQYTDKTKVQRAAQESLSSLCRKIVIFSSIMLITTILCMIISAIWDVVNGMFL